MRDDHDTHDMNDGRDDNRFDDRFDDRHDERVDETAHALEDDAIRALARETYHVPHAEVPRDAIWEAISARRERPQLVVHRVHPRPGRRLWPMFAALAATLAVGVAIGRGVNSGGAANEATRTAATDAAGDSTTMPSSDALPLMLAQLTAEHFDRSEALLVSARQNLDGGAPDESLSAWARDLLSTTRLLLDTDELGDARTRQLLQDLELTLALIVQAQSSGRAVDAAAVRDDLNDGDLLLRVRSASMPTMLSTQDVRGMSE
jgi:hypothetical protein